MDLGQTQEHVAKRSTMMLKNARVDHQKLKKQDAQKCKTRLPKVQISHDLWRGAYLWRSFKIDPPRLRSSQ